MEDIIFMFNFQPNSTDIVFMEIKLILMFYYNLFIVSFIFVFFVYFMLMLRTDTPKFGEPIFNVTIPVGREAVFSCVVDNLQTYKVIYLQHLI